MADSIQPTAINKLCPRCGAEFVCTHDRFCQCVGIDLTENARAFLRTHYKDCLCRNCLLEINELPFNE